MSDSDDGKGQGFTQIPNDLYDAINLFDFSKRELKVVHVILRKTLGWKKELDYISGGQISDLSGLTSSASRSAVRTLVDRNIVIKSGRNIGINKDLNGWKSDQTGSKQTGSGLKQTGPKQTAHPVQNEPPPVQNEPLNRSKTDRTKETNKLLQNKSLNKREEIQELIKFDDKTEIIKKTKSSELEVSAQGIFDFWIETMNKTGRTIFSAKRKKAVMKRLKEYPVDEIKLAIINCAASDWHMGRENPDKVNNDLELICRDSEHLERFRDKVNPRANSDTFNPAPDEQDDDEFVQVGFFRVRKTPEQKLNNDCIEGEVIQ